MTASGNNIETVEKACRAVLKEFKIKIHDVECELIPANNQLKVVFHLQLRGKRVHTEIIRRLSSLDGVSQIAWKLNIQQA